MDISFDEAEMLTSTPVDTSMDEDSSVDPMDSLDAIRLFFKVFEDARSTKTLLNHVDTTDEDESLRLHLSETDEGEDF